MMPPKTLALEYHEQFKDALDGVPGIYPTPVYEAIKTLPESFLDELSDTQRARLLLPLKGASDEASEEALSKEYDSCKSDFDRWKFVIKYAPRISMTLDNDQTSFSWDDGKTWREFHGYIGWDDCAVALGEALGLKSCEPV